MKTSHASFMNHSTVSYNYKIQSPMSQFMSEYGTDYSCKKVDTEIIKSSSSQNIEKCAGPSWKVNETNKVHIVTIHPTIGCDCSFFSTMCLPCRHIIGVANNEHIAPTENWIPDRFKKTFMYPSENFDKARDQHRIVLKPIPKNIPHNSRDSKFKSVTHMMRDIANTMSILPNHQFENIFQNITRLSSIIEQGQDVTIQSTTATQPE